MSKFPFKAIFYDKPDGTEPAKEFLLSLDTKMRAKMDRTINVIRHGGTTIREPYSKHLDDGIFEVRAKIGSDISRVLFFFFSGKRFILTHGFVKKTQKTPRAEIEQAKRYRQEYLDR
jgi:phage-related protein